MTAPPTGSLVRYQHPSWGPARGRVLRVNLDQPGREVLVQDLAPTGAREWWPLSQLERDPGPDPEDFVEPDPPDGERDIERAENAYADWLMREPRW